MKESCRSDDVEKWLGCSLGYVKIAYRHSYADDAAIYKNDPCKTSFRMVKESCRSDNVEKIVGWVGLGWVVGWVGLKFGLR